MMNKKHLISLFCLIFALTSQINCIPSYSNGAGGHKQPCSPSCVPGTGLVCQSGLCLCPQDHQYSVSFAKCIYCPTSWTLFKGNCVRYVDHGVFLSWEEAREKCRSEKADLVDIDPVNYYQFVVDLTLQLNITNAPFYIGVQSNQPVLYHLNYTTLITSRVVYYDGLNWECLNIKDSVRCKCALFRNGFEMCSLANSTSGNPDVDCKRCVYVNNKLQLSSLDCTANTTVQRYVCQKTSNVYPYTTIYKQQNNYQGVRVTSKTCYLDSECPPGSVCISGSCTCGYQSFFINGRCVKCQLGWKYFDGSCYLLPQNKTNLREAYKQCLDQESTLLQIDEYTTNKYPSKLFKFISYLGLKVPFWIDGFRQTSFSLWQRLDNSSLTLGPWTKSSLGDCPTSDVYFRMVDAGFNGLVVNDYIYSQDRNLQFNFVCQKRESLNASQIAVLRNYLNVFNSTSFVVPQISQNCLVNGSKTFTGLFFSPNHPNNYPNNEDCAFSISVPSGYRVGLTYIQFDTEQDFDPVNIYSGRTISSTLLNTLSSKRPPFNGALSTGKTMLVTFTSNSAGQRTGFLFRAEAVPV